MTNIDDIADAIAHALDVVDTNTEPADMTGFKLPPGYVKEGCEVD